MRQQYFYLIVIILILAVFLAGIAFFPAQIISYLPFFNEEPVALLPVKDFSVSKDPADFNFKVHDVLITSEGFQPKSLTIALGDAARWINTDAVLHWPASDPHPTHTGVIGFDSNGGLANGEIYIYVFDHSGIYTYHDHLQALTDPRSTNTGVIKVK